jgi:hypothetical protein
MLVENRNTVRNESRRIQEVIEFEIGLDQLSVNIIRPAGSHKEPLFVTENLPTNTGRDGKKQGRRAGLREFSAVVLAPTLVSLHEPVGKGLIEKPSGPPTNAMDNGSQQYESCDGER